MTMFMACRWIYMCCRWCATKSSIYDWI